MISREEALKIIGEHVKNENIIKHMLATEAIMRSLGKKLEPEKKEDWALAGLLHDGDYCEQVPEERHGIQIGEWLKEKGCEVSEEVLKAMAAHNKETGVRPESKMGWGLFICDSLTGLIVATALVRPDKKLSSVTVESVLKKFNQPSFAKGTRREDIKLCEEKLGIELEEFIRISLLAMQEISDDLGL